MLSEVFTEVYEKFKLNLYKNMFVNLQERDNIDGYGNFYGRGDSCPEES